MSEIVADKWYKLNTCIQLETFNDRYIYDKTCYNVKPWLIFSILSYLKGGMRDRTAHISSVYLISLLFPQKWHLAFSLINSIQHCISGNIVGYTCPRCILQ